VQAGAVLAAAVGVGRFVFTPILPLMQEQAGVSAQAGSAMATSNYLGYLVGALASMFAPRWLRTSVALRICGVGVVASVGLMAATDRLPVWCALRGLAGAAGAVMFVVAAGAALTAIPSRSRHLIGWAYGGVGAGIAASGLLVLAVDAVGTWRQAWLVAALVAAVLVVVGWRLGDRVTAPPREVGADGTRRPDGRFGVLAVSYFLEGVGYIVAGTFLVAAITSTAPDVGPWVWVIVGAAALPSCVAWTSLSKRVSLATLLSTALVVQAVGIAVAAHAGSGPGVLPAAALFGGTFMGVTTLTLAAGTQLQVPSAVAFLSAVYAVGQMLGPVLVLPWLGSGYRQALGAAAVVVLGSAAAAAVLRIRAPRQRDPSRSSPAAPAGQIQN
jgi:MFS family permease